MERWQNIGSEHPKDVGPVKIYPLRLGMSLNRQPPKKSLKISWTVLKMIHFCSKPLDSKRINFWDIEKPSDWPVDISIQHTGSIERHKLSEMWVFPKIMVPQNGWCIINGKPYWNGWFGGVSLFSETSMYFHRIPGLTRGAKWPCHSQGGIEPCTRWSRDGNGLIEGTLWTFRCVEIFICNTNTQFKWIEHDESQKRGGVS